MRHKRPGERAAGKRLHHRRLDLEVAARRHECPNARDHTAPRFEHCPRIGIHDQIQIALAIACFDVGQPVPLLGQRQEALRQEVQARRPDGQLVGLRAEHATFDADPIAEVEQLEDAEVEFRHRVLPHIDLHVLSTIRQLEEVRLPEGPNGEDAPTGRRLGSLDFERVVFLRTVRLDQRRNRVTPVEPIRIDRDAELREPVEVRLPLLNLFVL